MATPIQFDLSEIVRSMRVMSRDLYSRFGIDLHQRATARIERLTDPLSGADAAVYLESQVDRLTTDLSAQAQAFPSHWWMLLLRFISPVIFGCNHGNYSRYRGAAEGVSAHSTRKLEGVSSISILGEPQIKRAIRLVVTAAAREDVRQTAGIVNAGATLVPCTNGPYQLLMTDELQESVDHYDTVLRLDDQDVLTRMGAAYLNPLEPDNVALDRTLTAVSALELPITPSSFRDDQLADLIQFAPVPVVLNPALGNLPWAEIPRELGVRIRVLATIMRLAFVDIGVRPTLWQRLHETGLINRPYREFDDYLTQVCVEANNWGAAMFPGSATVTRDEALSVMTDVTGGRSGRYYGPAVRLGHDFFCIDLLPTWMRLESIIAASTSGGGPVPNMRAEMWENAVRRAIDQTAWKPNPTLAAAVSRPLKRDGRIFSDLDAAGARDGTLLIVSCKSWQMTERYDNLDYSSRKNRANDVIKAAKKIVDDIANISTFADQFVAPHKLVAIQGMVCVSMPLLLTPEETCELRDVAPNIDVLTLPELVSRLDGAALRHYSAENWRQYLAVSYHQGPHRER